METPYALVQCLLYAPITYFLIGLEYDAGEPCATLEALNPTRYPSAADLLPAASLAPSAALTTVGAGADSCLNATHGTAVFCTHSMLED